MNNTNQKKVIPYETSKEKLNNINKYSNQRGKTRLNTFKKKQTSFGVNHRVSFDQNVSDDLMNNINDEFDIAIDKFLKTDPEDMDYDDAIRRDKRTFRSYYLDKIQTEQMNIKYFFQ